MTHRSFDFGKVSQTIMPLLLSLVLLGTGGCVAAGLAAVGPVLTSVVAIGDRSVERTVPADLQATWGATVDVLSRMAVKFETSDKSSERWQFKGTGEAATVYGTLEPVTARMTKVSVRVEVGKLFSDKRTAEELLNQVATSLAGPSPSNLGSRTAAEESAARLQALQREIERLGAKLDESRDVRNSGVKAPAPAPPAAPTPTLATIPIIVVPTSAGIPSLEGPTPAFVELQGAPRVRGNSESRDGALTITPGAILENDSMATSMTSVEPLRPVEGLTVRPAGR